MASIETRGNVANQALHQTINGNVSFHNSDDKSSREQEECLRALLLDDPRQIKDSLKARKGKRAAGTCKWFLKIEELSTWRDGDSSASNILWLSGHPGTGKSMLSIFLVEELEQMQLVQDANSVAYFFYDNTTHNHNTALAMLRGLIYQLCRQHPSLINKYLLPEFVIKKERLFTTFHTLWSIFAAMAMDQSTGRKFIVIDALDECDLESQYLFLEHLEQNFGRMAQDKNVANVRFFITSRPYQEIREVLEEYPHRTVASFPQVAKLALKKRYTFKLREAVTDALRSRAEGTFLWVGLACAELERLPAKAGRDPLDSLPIGLTALYNDLLRRATENAAQSDEGSDVVTRMLSVVSVSMRPLTVSELSIACYLHLEEDLEERNLFTESTIDLCRSMIVVEEGQVRLLHKSVRDFLFRSATGSFPSLLDAHAQLSYRCIDHLVADYHDQCLGNLFESYDGFLEYAALYWPEHARSAGDCFQIQARQREFFSLESASRHAWSTLLLALDVAAPDCSSLFHIAAHWGIIPILAHAGSMEVLNEPINNHRPTLHQFSARLNNFKPTPLECAVHARNVEIFPILLKFCVVEDKEQLLSKYIENNREDTELSQSGIKHYSFPVTSRLVESIAINTTVGPQMAKALIDVCGVQYFLDGEILDHITRNKSKGQELMRILIEACDGRFQPEDQILKNAIRNHSFDDSTVVILLDMVRERQPILQMCLAEAIRRRGCSFVTQICETFSLELQLDYKLLNAATNRESDKNEMMETIVKLSSQSIRAVSHPVLCRLAQFCQFSTIGRVVDLDKISITPALLSSAVRNTVSGDKITAELLSRNSSVQLLDYLAADAACNPVHGKAIIETLLSHALSGDIKLSHVLCTALAYNADARGIAEAFLLYRPGVTQEISQQVIDAITYNCGYSADPRCVAIAQQTLTFLLDNKGFFIPQDRSVIGAVAVAQLSKDRLLPHLEVEIKKQAGHKMIPWAAVMHTLSIEMLHKVLEQAYDSHAALEGLIWSAVQEEREDIVKGLLFDQESRQTADDLYANGTYAAVLRNHRRLVSQFLHCHSNVKNSYHAGIPLVGIAARKGYVDIVRIFIEAGADVNMVSESGFNALGLVAQVPEERDDHVTVAQILLENGSDVNIPEIDQGDSLLSIAIRSNNYRIAAVLIEQGKNLRLDLDNCRRAVQYSASQIAPWWLDSTNRVLSKLKIIKMLGIRHENLLSSALASNAYTDAYFLFRSGIEITQSATERLLAVSGPEFSETTLRFLFRLISLTRAQSKQRGSDLFEWIELSLAQYIRNHSCSESLVICRLAFEYQLNVSTRGLSGHTALEAAISLGYCQLVEWLLAAGASANDIDYFDCNPIHYAVQMNLDISKCLVRFGALWMEPDGDGSTVLHRAAFSGQPNIVEWIIEEMSLLQSLEGKIEHMRDFVNALDNLGRTALHLALYRGNFDIVELLIDNGAYSNIADTHGITLESWLDSESSFKTSICQLPESRIESLSEIFTSNKLNTHAKDHIFGSATRVVAEFGFDRLAWLLFRKKIFDDAQTAWEMMLSGQPRDTDAIQFNKTACDECGICPVRGPLQRCKICDDYKLCTSCWDISTCTNADALLPSWSRDHRYHDFLCIPGPGWTERSPHNVNEDGETHQQWMERLNFTLFQIEKDGQEFSEAEYRVPEVTVQRLRELSWLSQGLFT